MKRSRRSRRCLRYHCRRRRCFAALLSGRRRRRRRLRHHDSPVRRLLPPPPTRRTATRLRDDRLIDRTAMLRALRFVDIDEARGPAGDDDNDRRGRCGDGTQKVKNSP